MLFNSYSFLFGFLPCVLIGWWGLARWRRPRLAFLTVASWFFYAWWDWRYLPVLIGATSVDYVAGLLLSRTSDEARRRLLLAASLTTNIGILAYFKYSGFFLESLDGIGKAVGLGATLPSLRILLPIGISFSTFNSMSYTIDCFRRRIEPTHHLLEYTTFVALFPHLIAGPIVRFTDLAGQLRRLTPRLTSEQAALGVFFLACGLVKKLLIADQLHPYVTQLYAAHAHLGLLTGWAAAVGYSLQLYFDFSGYSDIAVGPAFLLGVRFPQNFNSPFKAQNISVVWGLVHGTFLGGHAVLRRAGLTPSSVVLNRIVTFALVCAAFVIFRSPNLP